MAKITVETAQRIADRVADGLPERMALNLERPPIKPGTWQKLMESGKCIANAYNVRLAERVYEMVQRIGKTTLKTMPALVWILERRFGKDFGIVKQGGGITVNVQTCVGLADDISKRARAFVKAGDAYGSRVIVHPRVTDSARVPVTELLSDEPGSNQDKPLVVSGTQ